MNPITSLVPPAKEHDHLDFFWTPTSFATAVLIFTPIWAFRPEWMWIHWTAATTVLALWMYRMSLTINETLRHVEDARRDQVKEIGRARMI